MRVEVLSMGRGPMVRPVVSLFDVEKAHGHVLVAVDIDAPRLAQLAAAELDCPNSANDFPLSRLRGKGYRGRCLPVTSCLTGH